MWDPTLDANALAARIDHTLLNPDAVREDVRLFAVQARGMGVAGACVAPLWVPLTAEILAGTAVKVVTVVGFPLGFQTAATKAFEAEDAVRAGADEIDMVLSRGLLHLGRHDAAQAEVRRVVEASQGRPVKVILETAALTEDEVKRAAEVSERGGAAFVKTSTGFGAGGATVAMVRYLRSVVGDRMQIKASGGIRDLADARAMLEAGADRLGTSGTAEILREARAG
jgi:deoxyribose-phosphate aldolase